MTLRNIFFDSLPQLRTLGFWVLVWTLLHLSLDAGAGQPSYPLDRTWTIENAVEASLAQDHRLLGAREKAKEAESRHTSAISAALPTLDASLKVLERQDAFTSQSLLFGGSPYNYYEVGAQFRQPLFMGFGIWAGLASKRKQQEIQKAEITILKRDITKEIIEAFFQVLLLQKKVETLEDTHRIQTEHFKVAKRRNKVGMTEELELLQIETNLALLQPRIISAKNDLKISAATFSKKVGLNEFDSSNLVLQGSLSPPSVEDGVASLPMEIKKSILSQEKFEEDRTLELAEHLPQLQFLANISRNATAKKDLVDGNRTSWSFGLELTIPLFSGLSSVAERSTLTSQQNQLQIEEAKIRKELALAGVTSKKQVINSKALIDASENALKLAQRSIKVAFKDFRVGKIPYSQVSDAQKNLVDAGLSFEEAKFDYIKNLATFFSTTGRPLSKLVKQLSVNNLTAPKNDTQ